jgi:hypothetical protein
MCPIGSPRLAATLGSQSTWALGLRHTVRGRPDRHDGAQRIARGLSTRLASPQHNRAPTGRRHLLQLARAAQARRGDLRCPQPDFRAMRQLGDGARRCRGIKHREGDRPKRASWAARLVSHCRKGSRRAALAPRGAPPGACLAGCQPMKKGSRPRSARPADPESYGLALSLAEPVIQGRTPVTTAKAFGYCTITSARTWQTKPI